MAGYKSASFDPDEAAAASDLASAASDAASNALSQAAVISNAASAASVKAAAASSKIAAQSAAWEAGGVTFASAAEINTGTEAAKATAPDQLLAAHLHPSYFPNRNAIINGGMDIWQRGTTTLTSPAHDTYFPDRFKVSNLLGDGTFDLLQSTETPAVGFPFKYSLKVDCTHIETAVAAAELMQIVSSLEGYDFKRFEGETATLSFWVKAVKTGIYCVAFRNNAADKAYVAEYTINSASTWEKKTVTLTFNSGGTFLYTTGLGLSIAWSIVCGSGRQTTANAWQSGDYAATSNQVNGLDSTDNNFWITGVQLELGSVATPFEFKSFAKEVELCKRYYERLVAGAAYTLFGMGNISSATAGDMLLRYVRKRVAPTMTYSVLRISDGGAASGVNGVGTHYIGLDSGYFTFTASGGGLTVGRGAMLGANNDAAAYIDFTAEL